jgi:predicted Fe-S protein YdhL (DUF1289 family)
MKQKSMISSPCISVCTVEEDTGYCKGCLRSLAEIAQWDSYSDAKKLEIWDLLSSRRENGAPIISAHN